MSTYENEVKKATLRAIVQEMPDAWVYKTADKFRSGIPDLIGVYKGAMFAIELKRSKKEELAAIQEWTGKQIQRSGGIFATIKGKTEVKEVITRIREEVNNKWKKNS